jgi:lipopolysaccharide assembly outer membrane protein LptD (OstA)
LKTIKFFCFFFVFINIYVYGQKKETPFDNKRNIQSINKTEEKKNNNKPNITDEKNSVKADTIKLDTIKSKKLDGKVVYHADDYVKLDQKNKLITLYNNAQVNYTDVELKSGIIQINYQKSEVYAGKILDSAKKPIQYPIFKQGANIVEPDSIRFNFKTKKALTWNSRTQQGELVLKGETSKRENDSVYFIKNARFSTSKNIDNPEYYFLARKIKFVPKKKVVTGLTNMYIADVPTPLALPFAFFPMTEDSQSGVIIPTFQDTNLQGYSLQNGGLYLALSDKYDLSLMGDYYTNGSYALRAETNYAWKYKFRGSINVRFENLVNGERGFPNYSKTRNYNIQWSHSQDAKANPNGRLSASVNLGSSQYFRQSLNQVNIGSQLNNSFNSSISYNKTFQTVPQVNLSLTATHSQNANTQSINMTLPTLQLSVDRIFPFASENGTKKGILQNINFNYTLRGENKIATTDSLFFTAQMFKDAKNGFEHNIPINTNFKILKYFSVSAGSNYKEVWQFQSIRKFYNNLTNSVETEEKKGFESFRTYDFNSSIGTTIYGTFKFKETSRIQGIRHTVRPSIGYSYTPSFSNYYEEYVLDATGRKDQYTRFENGMFSQPSQVYASNVNFSLTNTFEAKVKDKDETKTEPKKIMLLNALNFDTRYNIASDSLAWAPLSITAGTAILDNKLNINFGATLDPYALDKSNKQINKFNINNGGSLFRLTAANINIGYTLTSKKEDKKDNNQGERNGGRTDDLFGTNTDFADRRQSQFNNDNEDEEKPFEGFYNQSIPWDLNLAYSATYGNATRENKIVNNSLMVSGNLSLTPRWQIGVSSGYDFVSNGVTFTQFRIERDLLSWRMDFSWVPFGTNTSWGFFIGIKSGMLSDIKWDKRALPDKRFK